MGNHVRYVIWGWAQVFDADGKEVADLAILSELAGFVDVEDLYATDFIGGTQEEDEIAAALEQSGQLRFSLRQGETSLRVMNAYVSRRLLTESELDWLREYTLAQWTDGLGECVFVPNGPYESFKLQPMDDEEAGIPDYPFVECHP